MDVISSDHWVGTEQGTLFARSWKPEGQNALSEAAFILFHDSLGCVELWRDFPAKLAEATGRMVVAYDRLGFGRSDAYPGALPSRFIADEAMKNIPRLCEHLGFKSIIPFGHSVGGGMAVLAAAAFPDRCTALITEAAQAFVEDRTLAGIRGAQETFQNSDQFERLERYHGPKARWVLDAWVNTWLSPAFRDWTLDDGLKQVRCSTLAIHGDGDEYGSEIHPNRIAGQVGGPGRAVILPACGHVPHREQPERVLREVRQFLSSAKTRVVLRH